MRYMKKDLPLQERKKWTAREIAAGNIDPDHGDFGRIFLSKVDGSLEIADWMHNGGMFEPFETRLGLNRFRLLKAQIYPGSYVIHVAQDFQNPGSPYLIGGMYDPASVTLYTYGAWPYFSDFELATDQNLRRAMEDDLVAKLAASSLRKKRRGPRLSPQGRKDAEFTLEIIEDEVRDFLAEGQSLRQILEWSIRVCIEDARGVWSPTQQARYISEPRKMVSDFVRQFSVLSDKHAYIAAGIEKL